MSSRRKTYYSQAPANSTGVGNVRRYNIGAPLPSQSRFLNSKAHYKGFSGPVGSGKSKALVWQALQMCVLNPGCWGLIGAPTYPMLRDVTQREFIGELERMGIDYVFYKQDEKIVIPEFGDSTVIFRFLDDPDKLRGTNLAWFGIDELTFCREEAWLQLESRLRAPEAVERCGFAVWTPRGKNWVYEKFGLHQLTSGDKGCSWKNYETIIAQPAENRNLPPDFYTNLKESFDERLYRQEVLGEYINMYAGEAYYQFSQSIHVKPDEAVLNPYLPIRWSLDFNHTPMTSVIAQIHDDSTPSDFLTGVNKTRKRVVVLDEIFLKNASTPDAVSAFLTKITDMNFPHNRPVEVYLYGDASGAQQQRASVGAKSDWEAVKKGLTNQTYTPFELRVTDRVPAANPPVKDRVNSVNVLLKDYNNNSRMIISPTCKKLIHDLERVVWEDGKSQLRHGSSDSEKMLNHISDALGYLCIKEFPFKGTNTGYRTETLF